MAQYPAGQEFILFSTASRMALSSTDCYSADIKGSFP